VSCTCSACSRFPEKIEPFERLIRRYPDALVTVWDHKDIDTHHGGGFDLTRCNVFDTPAGIRLLISRERDVAGKLWVHASASILNAPAGKELADMLRMGGQDPAAVFCRKALETWTKLAGGKLPSKPDFIGFTPGKGVPNWFARIPS
jgi:hypothetical protein